ncbi:MAG TPA: tRNA lysidine(34) synthetase TilS, partial [Planctomycetota bacterium]
MNILRKAFLTIEGYDLIRKAETVLCAVSGGPDSVALLTILKEINEMQDLGWKIHIAHFNHGLRGKEADADEAFVKSLAEKLQLPFHRGAADVKALRKAEGLSLEEAARKARHAWLRETALGLGAADKGLKIALGHNLDDQAETILHRI